MKTMYKAVVGAAAIALAAGSVVMELSSAHASDNASNPTVATSDAGIVTDSVASPAVGSAGNESTATSVASSANTSHSKLGAFNTAATISGKPSISGAGSSGDDDESDDASSDDAQDD